jgi:beta-mannosidase
VELQGDAVLGRFTDSTYAYRFGPRGHDLVVATLMAANGGETIAQTFYFPGGRPVDRSADLGVEASAQPSAPGEWRVTVRAKRFAQSVALDTPGFLPEDDFFHVEPGGTHTVCVRGTTPTFAGRVFPLNALAPTKIACQKAAGV